MTRRHQVTSILIFFSPILAFAGAAAEIPTTIQVVDEYGATVVSPARPPPSTRRAPIVVTPGCLSMEQGTLWELPASHPLSARIESEERKLRVLLSEYSLAPYFIPSTESVLEEAVILSTHSSTPSVEKALRCLEEAGVMVTRSGGKAQIELFRTIASTTRALRYAQAIGEIAGNLPSPETLEESRYASDLLLKDHPVVTSLSIDEQETRIHYVGRASILGIFPVTYDALVRDTGTHVFVSAPWWLFVADDQRMEIEKASEYISFEGSAVAERFRRAEELLRILSSLETP